LARRDRGWKPSLNPDVELRDLPLTPEEGFIASRLDGATDLRGLSALTGLSPERIDAALEKLGSFGAVLPPEGAEKPGPGTGNERGRVAADTSAVGTRGKPAPGTRDEAASATADEAASATGDASASATADETAPATADEAATAAADAAPAATADEPAAAATHRKLYETSLQGLAADERAERAKAAVEPELSAFCFDALPAVIHALLDNPRFGLPQARLVATHHRNPSGLEALAARAALAADAGVRRALLRNPQLSVGLLRRLQGGRRLLEQHKLVVSRDVPEQTRRIARDLFRARFTSAEAEERVELIVKTEGRCLASVAGLPIDGKTAALLCSRPYTSTLLVQNIARWAACPPALIAHLLKQELVRRSPALKVLLQRHPNAKT
jgi:hypothetical protein